MKNIVLCGTPEFTIPFFQVFLDSAYYNVIGIITRAAKEKNGKLLDESPVAKWAKKNNLLVLEVKNINKNTEVIDLLLQSDAVLVFAFGQIISEKVLSIPRYGFFNIHPSKLPNFRGPSPIQAAIMAGLHETSLTLMKMNMKMDEGDIIAQKSFLLNPNHNVNVVFNELGKWGPNWVITNLVDFFERQITRKQISDLATYCLLIKNEDYYVDKEQGIDVINKIRALGYVFMKYKGNMIKCFLARLAEKNDVFVVNGVVPIYLQTPGKRVLHIKNFLNGFNR